MGYRDEWKGLGTVFCPAVSLRSPLEDNSAGGGRGAVLVRPQADQRDIL